MIKTIKSWEDLNSVEMIYKAIRWKELGMGEDFIDQNESIVKEVPFATWLLGRGYINKEQLNSFLNSNDMYSGLQNLLGGYDEPYCVFPKKEFNEDYFKEPLVKLIKSKDDNPDNYEFNYLTKEQYENRFDIESEEVKEIKIKR
ncbi:MAG: hypothetical protein E6182_10205 [Clostridioides difficile]|nr:hypothetical protein [Clostridioides difficile]